MNEEKLKNLYSILLSLNYSEIASGHLSYRDPDNHSLFHMIPRSANGDVGNNDYRLACVDMNTGMILNNINANSSGVVTHAQMYKANKDVHCIAHVHGPYTTAFSTLNKPLKICFQEACIFYNDFALYSQYDGLIDDQQSAQRITKCMAGHHTIILANHGALCSGDSIEAVGFRLVVLERLCWTLLKCGYDNVTEIPPSIAADTHKLLASSGGLKFQYNNFLKNHEFSKFILQKKSTS